MSQPEIFHIGIPVYELVDLLDVAAPAEMFYWMAQNWKSKTGDKKTAKVILVGATTDPVRTLSGVSISPTLTFDDCPQLDLLWVPGGDPAALNAKMNDPVFINFLQKQSEKARFVTSVCEGALLLASAGLLNGYRATTHWAFISCLERYPEITVVEGYPRFVVNYSEETGKYVVTGGGVSSGLDESLELISLVSAVVLETASGKDIAQQVQLTTQYYPRPPVWGEIPGSNNCPLDDLKQKD